MAKSMVAHSRQQDKEMKDLADEIHLGMYSLTKIYKPTQEFAFYFQHGMFVKSNPGAFPHVMHFLLHNLDPAEFSTRFFWPLFSDKTKEKEFRQSCVKYINDLNKRHNLELEEVGSYIVVVPGGMKFMKVLQCLIHLLQTETLRVHQRDQWLDLPTETIFDSDLRARMKIQYEALQRVSQSFSHTIQKEMKMYQKKNEILRFYTKQLEEYHAKSSRSDDQERLIRGEVSDICQKMRQVMSLVTDVEKTCGSAGAEPQTNPFERIRLTKAIGRITEHHKWTLPHEEYTHKIGCASILRVASQILQQLQSSPINVPRVNLIDVVNQNHDMGILLRNLSATEGDLQVIQRNLKADQSRHQEHVKTHAKIQIPFPERDYPLPEMEDYDLGAFYCELQRRPDIRCGPLRLALQDVVPEMGALSPPQSKSLNSTSNWSLSNTTAKKGLTTTVKKRTKAMSVLKTISRPNKRPKIINMDALRDLARNGFDESLVNASSAWKKKSTNLSSKEASTTATRLSGIFSESLLPKFMPNSTSIFNSTTNEQAQLQASVVHLGDITAREQNQVHTKVGVQEEMAVAKQFKEITKEEQENILDCSDSLLIN